MKVRTLRDNVLTLNKKGTILDIPENEARRLLFIGVVEEVKEEPKREPAKKTTTKKTTRKSTNKEGE